MVNCEREKKPLCKLQNHSSRLISAKSGAKKKREKNGTIATANILAGHNQNEN